MQLQHDIQNNRLRECVAQCLSNVLRRCTKALCCLALLGGVWGSFVEVGWGVSAEYLREIESYLRLWKQIEGLNESGHIDKGVMWKALDPKGEIRDKLQKAIFNSALRGNFLNGVHYDDPIIKLAKEYGFTSSSLPNPYGSAAASSPVPAGQPQANNTLQEQFASLQQRLRSNMSSIHSAVAPQMEPVPYLNLDKFRNGVAIVRFKEHGRWQEVLVVRATGWRVKDDKIWVRRLIRKEGYWPGGDLWEWKEMPQDAWFKLKAKTVGNEVPLVDYLSLSRKEINRLARTSLSWDGLQYDPHTIMENIRRELPEACGRAEKTGAITIRNRMRGAFEQRRVARLLPVAERYNKNQITSFFDPSQKIRLRLKSISRGTGPALTGLDDLMHEPLKVSKILGKAAPVVFPLIDVGFATSTAIDAGVEVPEALVEGIMVAAGDAVTIGAASNLQSWFYHGRGRNARLKRIEDGPLKGLFYDPEDDLVYNGPPHFEPYYGSFMNWWLGRQMLRNGSYRSSEQFISSPQQVIHTRFGY